MAQGDGSTYPVLPISFSIIVGCYMISLVVARLFDFFYDIYLIRFCSLNEKHLLMSRVRSDIQRLRNLMKTDRIEAFDPNEAKSRLTIITHLTNERISSKENRQFFIINTKTESNLKSNEKMEKNDASVLLFILSLIKGIRKENEENSDVEKHDEAVSKEIKLIETIKLNESNRNQMNDENAPSIETKNHEMSSLAQNTKHKDSTKKQ